MSSKIIATVGPVTQSEEIIKQITDAGAAMLRLNMSHGTVGWNEGVIETIRKVSSAEIMMDTKGPEIRTCFMEHKVHVEKDDTLVITNASRQEEDFGKIKKISVTYQKFHKILSIGDTIVIDNGAIIVEVQRIEGDLVMTHVLEGGTIGSVRHVNLPGVYVDLPILTDIDKKNIKMGIGHGVEYIALSFVRDKQDIQLVRDFLQSHGSHAKIIAKIEHQAALDNLDEILECSDMVMVARGDLGIETPWFKIGIIEQDIIKKAQEKKIPTIVATEMMASMKEQTLPTRAEVVDVTVAVQQGASYVMLSDETTVGKYPVRTVACMKKIIDFID